MEVRISHSSGLKGSVSPPGDKSISHRGIIFGALAQGNTRLKNFLMAQDCIDTIKIFKSLGISISIDCDNTVLIEGKGIRGLSSPDTILDAGNSGTTARLLMGVLAGQSFDSVLTGDSSLQKRPMDRVTIPLRQMGAKLEGEKEENFLPIRIMGRDTSLRSIDYTMPVASAQVKSAIILASLYADDKSLIRQNNPSRDHTEIMLKGFGGEIRTEGNLISVSPEPNLYGQDLIIPGDISSAAYFLTAGILAENSEITIKNVGINPSRSGIRDVYKAMGAKMDIENLNYPGYEGEPRADISLKSSSLTATKIEGALIPRLIDEIPIIALAATQAHGTTIIKDASELRVKESDRIEATVHILRKFGADIEAMPDGMVIKGPSPLLGTQVNPGTDHRMVMMAAVAGLIAEGVTTIKDADWVKISYPDFFSQIDKLGS